LAQGLAQKYVNLLLVLLLLLSMYPVFPRAGAYTTSPSFPQQEIIDQTRDWIDLTNKKLTSSGDRYTDIVSVDYFSDGKILNSTLWLLLPFKERPIRENVNFGMYIDADFNSKTGYGGIDYQIEIRWNNDTQQWSKVTESWSHYGDTRVLENISNYSGFYERGGKYVVLSADLTKLFHPQKYKVLFYAEVKKNDSTKTDFTRWVAIPPLQLIVSTSPGTVEITKGEQKTIEVKVNSTQGYEPHLQSFADSVVRNVDYTHDDRCFKERVKRSLHVVYIRKLYVSFRAADKTKDRSIFIRCQIFSANGKYSDSNKYTGQCTRSTIFFGSNWFWVGKAGGSDIFSVWYYCWYLALAFWAN